MSEKKQVRTMQVLVVFFIVLSVVIAMDPPTFIAQLMGISWEHLPERSLHHSCMDCTGKA